MKQTEAIKTGETLSTPIKIEPHATSALDSNASTSAAIETEHKKEFNPLIDEFYSEVN
jgi:hypothetical protein